MTMKICLVTGARSDWPMIEPLLDAGRRRRDIETTLIVTGAHLSRRHGFTLETIESAGWSPAARVEILDPAGGDSALSTARATGRAVMRLADAMDHLAPAWIVVAGDRYESFAAAVAATMLAVPLAHIGGGETDIATNQDGSLRNAITKLAQLHLVSGPFAARRVLALGEEAWRVHPTGLPSLDSLKSRRGPRASLASLGLAPDRPFVMSSFLPVTLSTDQSRRHLDVMLAALDPLAHVHKLLVLSNADSYAAEHDQRVRRWAEGRSDATVVHSLSPDLYATALAECACYVGNSSSGVIETPVFGTPSIIVGERQRGRVASPNTVVLEQPTVETLGEAIRRQITHGRYEELRSLYGDGAAAGRVLDALIRVRARADLLTKRLIAPNAHEPADRAESPDARRPSGEWAIDGAPSRSGSDATPPLGPASRNLPRVEAFTSTEAGR